MVVVWEIAALLESVTALTVVMFPKVQILVDNGGKCQPGMVLVTVQVEASGAEGQTK